MSKNLYQWKRVKHYFSIVLKNNEYYGEKLSLKSGLLAL